MEGSFPTAEAALAVADGRRILIKGAFAHPKTASRTTDYLLEGGKIAAIGSLDYVDDAIVVDASSCLVIPGFVDGHRHLWQSNLRGLLGNSVLADYYRRVRMGYSTAFTPDDVYVSVLAGALEALADGVTTVLDHAHIMNSPEHADAAVAALKESGLRAIFCYGYYAAPTKDKAFGSRQDRYRDIKRVRERLLSSDDGLVTMGAALTEHWLCPSDVTRDEVKIARDLGLRHITQHVGSTPGTTDIHRFRCTKCYGPEFIYSHCNSCQSEFFDFAKVTGGGIVVTPETELGMGMGRPVIGKILGAGVPLGLGADVVSYGGGDLFTAARLAIATAREQECSAAVEREEMPSEISITTEDALHWMTKGGAQAIGVLDRTGSLEVGKAADIILLRTDSLHMSPLHDTATSVVMHARSSDIAAVLVNGRPLVVGGKYLNADVKAVTGRLQASQDSILSRLEESRDENSETVKAYDALLAEKQR